MENKKHLRFNLRDAYEAGAIGHPQEVMKLLGIAYQHATPQSMGDQWWFWNCKGVPIQLPEYLTELNVDPIKCIGFGLSEEQAIEISNG